MEGGGGGGSPRGVVLGAGSVSLSACVSELGGMFSSSYSAGVTAPLSLDTHSSSSPPISTWITAGFVGERGARWGKLWDWRGCGEVLRAT